MTKFTTNVRSVIDLTAARNRLRSAPADRIRLLYVQPSEVFGGAERQAVLHISRLADYGFDVVPVVGPGRLIVSALEAVDVQSYVFLDHLTHEASYPVAGIEAVRFAAGATRDFIATQRSIYRLSVDHRVNLILANRSTGWIAASGVARKLGIPLVWRGGGRPTSALQLRVLALLGSFFGPDLLLANCEAVRRDLAKAVSCPSEILRNGVDTRRFDPLRVRPRFRQLFGVAPDVPMVGFPSRPAPEKGMELLGRVAELTARRIPAVRFFVAGEFGWRKRYQQLFAERGLGERIQFLGHVDDVESFLASCDAVVLTSRANSIEGSPNALLEAMAMERPVVATRVGGVDEAITDGVEGFLVAPDDAAGFARRLCDVLGDCELRRRMGAAGRARILRDHDDVQVVTHLAGKLRSVYRGRAQSSAQPWTPQGNHKSMTAY